MSNSADVYGFEWCIQECSRPCFQPQNFCILGCYDFQYLRKYVSMKSSYFFNKALFFPLMFFNTNCNFDKLKNYWIYHRIDWKYYQDYPIKPEHREAINK